MSTYAQESQPGRELGIYIPPGLMLPGPGEPTEQFLTPNFREQLKQRGYPALAEYGSFLVALAIMDGRTQTMPREPDFDAMYDEGWGISFQSLTKSQGGIRKLQRHLHYFPRGYDPPEPEMLERFRWIVDNGYAEEDLGDRDGWTVEALINWGTEHDLTPGRNRVYNILGSDTKELRKIISKESEAFFDYPYLELYSLGAQVLDEHGRPLTHDELNEQYAGAFHITPGRAIRRYFGSNGKFWLEFGFIPDATALSDQDFIDVGVRWAIQNDRTDLTRNDVDTLSAEMRFPSRYPINKRERFRGVVGLRKAIEEGYEKYLQLEDNLAAQGVTSEISKLACSKFSATDEYVAWMSVHGDILAKISANRVISKNIRGLIENGFNLLDEEELQDGIWKLGRGLYRLGIHNENDVRFVIDLIPRCNADEILDLMAA